MKPDVANLIFTRPFGRSDPEDPSHAEAVFHEVRFRIHGDLASDAVGPRNAADEQQGLVRLRVHTSPRRGKKSLRLNVFSVIFGHSRRRYSSSRNSTVAFVPSSSAVAPTSVRIAAAVRP